ncbi:MAG: TadE/TadG family type IV pilus assembly protein [Polyangia bacterium]|jgi:Flp pilus assembly protein TadG
MRRIHPRPAERGAAAVEFALIFPLLALVLFGALEFGWVLFQQFNLANAIRDGIRQGVTVAQTSSPDPGATAVQVARQDLQKLGVTTSSVVLTATYAGSVPTRTMTLSADMTYRKLTGFIPTPAHLTYSMTMMLEMQ